MKDFNALTAEEQIAKIKASERAERDRKDAKFDAEQQWANASICQGCGRRWLWGQAVMNRAKPAVYVPEARGFYHLSCWERKREGR